MNLNFTNINNALEIIKEQRNIILCELMKEFPLGCNITYLNEDNIEIEGLVINHKVTNDNIPKIDIRTLDSKMVKLVPISKIINKSLNDKLINKQKCILELGNRFNISGVSINDEKRLEIFKALMLEHDLISLTEFKLSNTVNKEKFIDFLLQDTRLTRDIMNMKFDKFVRTIDSLVLNNQELIDKHNVSKNYKATAQSEIEKSIRYIIVMQIIRNSNLEYVVSNNVIENK